MFNLMLCQSSELPSKDSLSLQKELIEKRTIENKLLHPVTTTMKTTVATSLTSESGATSIDSSIETIFSTIQSNMSTSSVQPMTALISSFSTIVDSLSSTPVLNYLNSTSISRSITGSSLFVSSGTVNMSEIISTSFAINSTKMKSHASSMLTIIPPSINISTEVVFTMMLDSSIVVTPSASINVTNSSSVITLSSIPLICPTTTVYINCSTDMYTINPTRVTNTTSSIANFTSIYNISSNLATKTVHNSTSSSHVIVVLPSLASTSFYNITLSPLEPSSTCFVVSTSAHIIVPPIRKCDVFLDEFTEAYIKFSRCMLHNMHPMHVCLNCSALYENFSKNHKKVFKDCGEDLIYSYNMQYQIIPTMFAAQELTWKSLECDSKYYSS